MTEQLYRCSGAPGCAQDGCSAFYPRRHIPHGANPPPWHCKSAGGDVRPVLEGTPRAAISQPTTDLVAIESARPWTHITADPTTLPEVNKAVETAWTNDAGVCVVRESWIHTTSGEWEGGPVGWCAYAWRPLRAVEAPPTKKEGDE